MNILPKINEITDDTYSRIIVFNFIRPLVNELAGVQLLFPPRTPRICQLLQTRSKFQCIKGLNDSLIKIDLIWCKRDVYKNIIRKYSERDEISSVKIDNIDNNTETKIVWTLGRDDIAPDTYEKLFNITPDVEQSM